MSGLRILELILQLKQHVKAFPDTTSTGSSYVSMDAMLGNTSSNSSNATKSHEFSRLHLPGALSRGCQELVDLGSELYIKELGLSRKPRADLLEASCSWTHLLCLLRGV